MPGRKGLGVDVETVDEYISAAPVQVQGKLRVLREAIKKAAPDAKEGISYRMPAYNYRGRMAWFGLFTTHIGLFIRPPVLEDHAEELRGYSMTKSSLHLPLDEKIPVALVIRLVRAAVKMNDERSA